MEDHLYKADDGRNADRGPMPSELQTSAWTTARAREQQTKPHEACYPADPDFALRGGYANQMIDAAMPLFGLVMRLRTLDELPHIAEVHKQVRNEVTNIVEEMRQHAYEPAHLLPYSYTL